MSANAADKALRMVRLPFDTDLRLTPTNPRMYIDAWLFVTVQRRSSSPSPPPGVGRIRPATETTCRADRAAWRARQEHEESFHGGRQVRPEAYARGGRRLLHAGHDSPSRPGSRNGRSASHARRE